jgi:hypothetical protein
MKLLFDAKCLPGIFLSYLNHLWWVGFCSPAVCTGASRERVEGLPDPDHVSTPYVERQNLNFRMGMRRFTRLTNAFSKKAEAHYHMVCLYTVFHNFVRLHKTLRCTPAMAAGLSQTLWTMARCRGADRRDGSGPEPAPCLQSEKFKVAHYPPGT